jgi:hypothetical protein
MRLEILIPAFIAVIPAFLVFYFGGMFADDDE